MRNINFLLNKVIILTITIRSFTILFVLLQTVFCISYVEIQKIGSFWFKLAQFHLFIPYTSYISASNLSQASSKSELRMVLRYISVVVVEVCPKASLMKERGILWSLAAVAHEWRAT